jgi:hypothetical protein
MAKGSGAGITVTVDNASGSGKAISNDITSIDIGTPSGVQDVTAVDKSAVERILLLRDGTITLNGVFNPAADMSHAVLSTCVSSIVTRTVVIVYPGTPTATLTMEVLFTDYQLKRGEDGSLTWTAPGQLANGTAPAWT